MSFSESRNGTSEIEVKAFGQKIVIESDPETGDAARRTTELTEIYERALASRSLPKEGVALDIGAGVGWFALAFAKAFPSWRVLAFEPDSRAFEQLKANTNANNLENVTCVNAAFHPDVQTQNQSTKGTLNNPTTARFIPLTGLAPRVAPGSNTDKDSSLISLPALGFGELARLKPTLVKIEAPFAEAGVAAALKSVPVHLVIGRLYACLRSDAFIPDKNAGHREYYLTHREHVLRRDYEDNFVERRAGLDVVVAMYNAQGCIVECIDSLLADSNPDIRVLVVDDGSTDGCGQLVTDRYSGSEQLVLLNKANGGCASARNFGRQHSDATHIAFVDADDRVDPSMFTALLETARYTGAYVTEGEFVFWEMDNDGKEFLRPSYEQTLYEKPGTHRIGDYDFLWISGRNICYGQPTIWRRVYRRDFLDQRRVWFPEHIRSFDDQIFQFLVGEYCGAIAHVRGVHYHYRQHPGQDIKQGDERHFYSFNMFRTIIIRALEEGWQETEPLLQSLINTMRWSYSGIRDDLKPIYREASVRFLAMVSKCFGHNFSADDLAETKIDGLHFLLEQRLKKNAGEPANYGFSRLEDWRWQPEFIRMVESTRPPAP